MKLEANESGVMPIDTFFIDSSEMIAPFLNAKKSRDGFDLDKRLHFMGRSGVKVFPESGLRVAYISGVDSDLLGTEIFQSDRES
jgi:hypothetical protein